VCVCVCVYKFSR